MHRQDWDLSELADVAIVIGLPDKSWWGYRDDMPIIVLLWIGPEGSGVVLTSAEWLEPI